MSQAKRKVSLQLLEPLAQKLNDLTTKACLNRDAYLDVVLGFQSKVLVSDAAGHRNSDEAKAFIKRTFADLRNFRPTSVNLTASTADLIDEACTAVNTWRDVFVNRVLFMLVGKVDGVAGQMEIESPYRYEAVLDAIRQDAPGLYIEPRLAALADFVHEDPFTSYRIALETAYPETRGRIYREVLGSPFEKDAQKRGLAGLNPLIEDDRVPNTVLAKEQDRMMKELLGEIDSLPEGEKNGRK